MSNIHTSEGVQNKCWQNVSLWHVDYSELKVIGTQEIQVKPLAFQSYLQDFR